MKSKSSKLRCASSICTVAADLDTCCGSPACTCVQPGGTLLQVTRPQGLHGTVKQKGQAAHLLEVSSAHYHETARWGRRRRTQVNNYRCTDGTTGWCWWGKACYATVPWVKAEWFSGCSRT